FAPVPYAGERGIAALLDGMGKSLGWEPIMGGAHAMCLADPHDMGAISLEPGGQFELSGAPVLTLHETAAELTDHLTRLHGVADPLRLGFLGLGHSPQWSRAQTPIMPKRRYDIMRAYMP